MAIRFSLLLVLIACGGAVQPAATPIAVQSTAVAAPRAFCDFEGPWSGTLRFEGADTYVSSSTATAQLFATTLEAHVYGGGWHLLGHANLSEDHVLRLQRSTWLAEGVAVEAGHHVSIAESEAGRVHMRPHPSAIENITFTETPGRWLGCDAVGLLEQPSDLEVLMLPVSSETSRIAFPVAISHLPGGAPFAEVRAESEEASTRTLRVDILERRGDAVRVRFKRYGGGSHMLLVGWIGADRLGQNQNGNSMISGGRMTDVDREECEAPISLPLFVEGSVDAEAGRGEAGHVDAGTRMTVLERDEQWAEVQPIGRDIRLGQDRRFFVPSPELQCTTRHGTHARTTQRVQIQATGLTCGSECECELRLTSPHDGRGTCQARLQCGAQVLFGDRASNGYFTCNTQEGRVSGADTAPTAAGPRGDPRFGLDGDVVSASDDEGGRLGVFHLEGRIIR